MDFVFNWKELIGYTGTVLIAASLMMNSIGKLRKVNLAGASTFAIYGLLVGAFPVFVLNCFISLVDIYYLVRMKLEKDYFELFRIFRSDNPFLLRFVEFYQDDIFRFFPSFQLDRKQKDYIIIFILRNMMPVGLFIARPIEDNNLHICLDYVIPRYRDLKTAHYFFQRTHTIFDELNCKYFFVHSEVKQHIKYLKKVGFNAAPEKGNGWFKREVQVKTGSKNKNAGH
ncbi:MAG TPA: hypothetical protein EYP36_02690 [Calditrichaeota bacterium]|nr:hypothetical protein [Calditrichota bacterium]